MKNILIIGTGNFSALLQRLLRDDFTVQVLSSRKASDDEMADAVDWADVIILAIPLKGYESAVSRIELNLNPSTLIIDVCSVKVKSQTLLHDLLPEHENWLISHPLFGPQSAAESTEGLQYIVCEEQGERAKQFIDFCKTKLELKIVRLSATEHDLQMAKAQGLTFFISEILKEIDVNEQQLMTPSYNKLLDVRRLVDVETQDLLNLIQQDNPYAQKTREEFAAKAQQVNKKY